MVRTEVSRARLLELIVELRTPAAEEAVACLPVEVDQYWVYPASTPGWSHSMEVKFCIAAERGSDVLGLADLVYETVKEETISIVLVEAGRANYIVALDVGLERAIAVMRATSVNPVEG